MNHWGKKARNYSEVCRAFSHQSAAPRRGDGEESRWVLWRVPAHNDTLTSVTHSNTASLDQPGLSLQVWGEVTHSSEVQLLPLAASGLVVAQVRGGGQGLGVRGGSWGASCLPGLQEQLQPAQHLFGVLFGKHLHL